MPDRTALAAAHHAPADMGPEATGFGDRIAGAVASRSSQLVLGLDPNPERLWPEALESAARFEGTPAERAARAVDRALCARDRGRRRALRGGQAPGGVLRAARGAGLGARCGALSISLTRTGCWSSPTPSAATSTSPLPRTPQAFFGETPTPFGAVPGLGADALTVNPLLGSDSLEPFLNAARARGGGLFVLVAHLESRGPRRAGAGAGRWRDGQRAAGRSGGAARGAGSVGASGLCDVGAVVGATAPERLARLRERMPHAVFLLPGVGAQGGRVEALAPAFVTGSRRRADLRLARDRRRLRQARRRRPPRRPHPRRLACASSPGTSRPECAPGALRRWPRPPAMLTPYRPLVRSRDGG